ncbi:MAG TPA: hypothetical protein VFB12_05215 [Ktedonobacteraceae bacterium]|nr:hypothetical protein [Ktedonobacteraceae bacterium]
MSNKETLLKGKPQHIVAGLVLCALLVLLLAGAALSSVSQNGPSSDGTRVTHVLPAGDREAAPSSDGTRVTLAVPAGDREAASQPNDSSWGSRDSSW